MTTTGRFRLRTLVLGIFLPGLLLVTGTLALWIGNDLSATIVRGFEGKLDVIGAICAAFIDGDDHEQVAAGLRQPTGFAFDTERGTLYTANLYEGKIRRFLGNAALPPLETGLEGIADLARDPRDGRLFLLSGLSLLALDPGDGKTNLVCTLPEEGRGIVFRTETTNRLLVMTASALLTIDPDGGAFRTLRALEAAAWRGLEMADDGRPVSIDIAERRLVVFDPGEGEAETLAKLLASPDGELFSFPTFGLRRIPRSATLLAGTPLGPAVIGKTNGLFTPYPPLPDGQGRLYRLFERYSRPLAAVREKSGLTFLVSCLLVNDYRNIKYIIDSSDDDGYSLTGYVDPTESEEKAADVVIKGKPFISAIKFWEDWGLMKSAYGPIRAGDGRISGMLAADVNIDVIRVKTREAMAIVLATGLGALVLAAGAAFQLARRIAVPVLRLKNFALQVAAGEFGRQIDLAQPEELALLGTGFNRISHELQTTVGELATADRLVEASRRRQELRKMLAAAADAGMPAAGGIAVRLEETSTDGWVRRGDSLLVWSVESPPEDPLDRVLLRRRLSLLAERLPGDGWAAAFRELAGTALSIALVDEAARTITIASEGAAFLLLRTANGHEWERLSPQAGVPLSFASEGGRLLVCCGISTDQALPATARLQGHEAEAAALRELPGAPAFVLILPGRRA